MNSSRVACIAAAIVAIGVSVACGTTNNTTTSPTTTGALGAKGDSCASTTECSTGLHCIANVCGGTATGTGGSGGTSSGGGSGGSAHGGSGHGGSGGTAHGGSGGTGGTGGSGGTGGTGGSGGSTAADSGTTATTGALGSEGDSCVSSTQCISGLECVPLNDVSSAYTGGICTLTNFGITATGKACTGECVTSTDCCELPVGLTVGTPAVTVNNCNDVNDLLIAGTSCTTLTAGDSTNAGIGCLLQAAYCGGCTANTWKCTNSQCIYNAPCSTTGGGGETYQGCPSTSRAGTAQETVCTAGACKAAAAATGCTVATDCEGKPYVAPPLGVAGTCDSTVANCACVSSSCYLKCAKDLDCSEGYTCNATSSLCTPVGACTTDAQCAASTKNILSTCDKTTSTCTVPCSNDLDCNPGYIPGFTLIAADFKGSVCQKAKGAATGTCAPVGCTTNADCNVAGSSAGQVTLFCVAPPATTTSTTVYSAITAGK